MGIIVGWIFGILLVIGIGVIVGLNRYINDESIKTSDTLFGKNDSKKVLVIFPHPDDEVTVSGTLSKLKRDPNTELTLVYLTKGEAGPTGGLVPQDQLGNERVKEIHHAAKILKADHLEVFDLGDGQLQNIEPNHFKNIIKQMIAKYEPSTIITFDAKVGLYGHLDHLLTGKYVYEVFREEKENPSFSPKRLYVTTLPKPMINTALKISTTFKERYPKDPKKGLPTPTVAIKMASEASTKGKVVRSHKTQWQVMGDLQPLYDKMPPWIYYRIFDREYFTLIDSKD